jgi:hypothetical protein
MRRFLHSLGSGLLGLALLGGASAVVPAEASAATIAPTTTCSNGVANTGGLGLICRVTIVNTITKTGGSSRTVVRECHGAAGDPTAACTTKTWSMNRLVTKVDQCNDSINGGGGTLRCSVTVTNNYVGTTPKTSALTVNECVGSGGGITTGCDPFPATTTGATVTQCNGSANGGTLVGLTCSATGTRTATGGVRINQCNGSANGGGALVICSASVTNHVGLAKPPTSATTTTGTTTTGRATPRPGLPETSTAVAAIPAATRPAELVILVAGFALLALLLGVRRFGGRRRA